MTPVAKTSQNHLALRSCDASPLSSHRLLYFFLKRPKHFSTGAHPQRKGPQRSSSIFGLIFAQQRNNSKAKDANAKPLVGSFAVEPIMQYSLYEVKSQPR